MILVVGGTGTLGVHVVQGLVAQGHAVRVLTRNPPAEASRAKSVEFVTGDERFPSLPSTTLSDVLAGRV